MFALVKPISVVVTERQLEWLDHRRNQGALSRSAALRIALDHLIEQEQAQAAIARPSDGH